MEDNKEIKLETLLLESTDLKTVADWPPNIRRFDGNKGTLFIAVDQMGRAIAMTFIPK